MRRAITAGERLRPAPRWIRAGAGLGMAAALALLLQGAGHIDSPVPCLFHELTGLSCLTCGMTRSLAATGTGNIAAALGHHPFGPVVAGAVAFSGLALVIEAVTGRRLIGRVRWRAGLLVCGALAVLYGAIRMAFELMT